MSKRFLVFAAFGLALALGACGDDEDSGGGAGCANAQMVCADNPDVEINCDEWDSAPASIKECAGAATTCEAVQTCLFGG